MTIGWRSWGVSCVVAKPKKIENTTSARMLFSAAAVTGLVGDGLVADAGDEGVGDGAVERPGGKPALRGQHSEGGREKNQHGEQDHGAQHEAACLGGVADGSDSGDDQRDNQRHHSHAQRVQPKPAERFDDPGRPDELGRIAAHQRARDKARDQREQDDDTDPLLQEWSRARPGGRQG